MFPDYFVMVKSNDPNCGNAESESVYANVISP